jgi:hypothetical protein
LWKANVALLGNPLWDPPVVKCVHVVAKNGSNAHARYNNPFVGVCLCRSDGHCVDATQKHELRKVSTIIAHRTISRLRGKNMYRYTMHVSLNKSAVL